MNILLLPCETMSNGATSKLPSGISSPCQRQQREWRNLRLLLSRPRENVVVSSTRAIVGSNSSSSSSSSSSSCLRREPRVRREAVCGTDMHTNDNDSSTLVTSPVTAWFLGGREGGRGKSAFSIERTATTVVAAAAETRERKGHECETVAESYARDASQIVLPPSVYKDTPQTRLSSARGGRGVAVGAAMAKQVIAGRRVKRVQTEREMESYIYIKYNRTCRRVCTFLFFYYFFVIYSSRRANGRRKLFELVWIV